MPHFGRKLPPHLSFLMKVEVLKGFSTSTPPLCTAKTLSLCIVVAMFDTTRELINQATSNSLFVFCCCNLIIVILLIGSLKPSSYSYHETVIPFSVVTNVDKNDKGTANAEDLFKERASVDAHEVSRAETGGTEAHNKEDDYEASSQKEEEEEEEEEDDNELRRRVEEFIEKINQGWRAEMLRTASLAPAENLQSRTRNIQAM